MNRNLLTRSVQDEPFQSARLIWNHKYDFRPKLHNTKFNYYFITAILKSQNSVSDLVSSMFKSGSKKAFTSNLVFKTEMMRYRTEMMRFRKKFDLQ